MKKTISFVSAEEYLFEMEELMMTIPDLPYFGEKIE
jgi:hypothetical protein